MWKNSSWLEIKLGSYSNPAKHSINSATATLLHLLWKIIYLIWEIQKPCRRPCTSLGSSFKCICCSPKSGNILLGHFWMIRYGFSKCTLIDTWEGRGKYPKNNWVSFGVVSTFKFIKFKVYSEHQSMSPPSKTLIKVKISKNRSLLNRLFLVQPWPFKFGCWRIHQK